MKHHSFAGTFLALALGSSLLAGCSTYYPPVSANYDPIYTLSHSFATMRPDPAPELSQAQACKSLDAVVLDSADSRRRTSVRVSPAERSAVLSKAVVGALARLPQSRRMSLATDQEGAVVVLMPAALLLNPTGRAVSESAQEALDTLAGVVAGFAIWMCMSPGTSSWAAMRHKSCANRRSTLCALPRC